MFKRETQPTETVQIILDGATTDLPAETNVAAGLLSIGKIISKISNTSGKQCAPHCLMGVCFECLMEIDGVQRQACMTQARSGMIINRNLAEQEGEKS